MPNDRTANRNAFAAWRWRSLSNCEPSPKPTYKIDGQTVSWESYIRSLEATVDWCDTKLIGLDPFEVRSQGYTVMATDFDPQSDFAQVADALEPATLRRADGSGSTAVASALRRAVTTREAAASDGKYTTSDVHWHLAAAELPAPPRLGRPNHRRSRRKLGRFSKRSLPPAVRVGNARPEISPSPAA